TRSRTATAGKPVPLYCAHRLPPSMLIHSPNSVPRNSRLRLTGSSLMTCAYPQTPLSGVTSRRHVRPKSLVAKAYGAMSPDMWRSNVAYAAPSSYRLASTHDTIGALPSPGTFLTTLDQFPPPSRVTCTLPSSVPTQTTCAFFGDSLIA